MLLYTNNHLTEQRLHSWDHQNYTIFTTQENLKKYKQPIEIMLLFFRHISTMGDKQNIKHINSQHWNLSAQDNHCNGVGLTRANLSPFLFKIGNKSKTGPDGTWLTTTKCDFCGTQVKRNKWFSLKAHYIKYFFLWDHLEISIRHTNTVKYST